MRLGQGASASSVLDGGGRCDRLTFSCGRKALYRSGLVRFDFDLVAMVLNNVIGIGHLLLLVRIAWDAASSASFVFPDGTTANLEEPGLDRPEVGRGPGNEFDWVTAEPAVAHVRSSAERLRRLLPPPAQRF